MTFDQFANQGDTAAWDPEAAAATKKAAEKIFSSSGNDDSVETDDEDAPKHDPNQPGEVPDPDLTLDP